MPFLVSISTNPTSKYFHLGVLTAIVLCSLGPSVQSSSADVAELAHYAWITLQVRGEK